MLPKYRTKLVLQVARAAISTITLDVRTHCRTGTTGRISSVNRAAVSTMRRPIQLGQKPQALHENATVRFALQSGQQLKIEWAQDSAFRFFPVQEDDRCGYRLHHADAALNKLLALAGRQEIRDFVDILHLHDSYLHLGAMAWAACGKDPGFTPGFLLDQAGRHVAYTQADLDRLNLRDSLDLKSLKKKWLKALEDAQRLTDALPPDEVGCLYLDAKQIPITPDPASGVFSALTRHYGSIRGAWPTVV